MLFSLQTPSAFYMELLQFCYAGNNLQQIWILTFMLISVQNPSILEECFYMSNIQRAYQLRIFTSVTKIFSNTFCLHRKFALEKHESSKKYLHNFYS